MKHQGLPDPSATDRCAPASPAVAAQVLEDAADLLLINGRCRGAARGVDDSWCVIAAIAGERPCITSSAYYATKAALTAHLQQHGHLDGIVEWNRTTEDDDEVRDTLLLVAKELRNTAVPV